MGSVRNWQAEKARYEDDDEEEEEKLAGEDAGAPGGAGGDAGAPSDVGIFPT